MTSWVACSNRGYHGTSVVTSMQSKVEKTELGAGQTKYNLGKLTSSSTTTVY